MDAQAQIAAIREIIGRMERSLAELNRRISELPVGGIAAAELEQRERDLARRAAEAHRLVAEDE